MKEVYNQVIGIIEGQRNIASQALIAYEPQAIQDADPELRRMREIEAIKLRKELEVLLRIEEIIKRVVPK